MSGGVPPSSRAGRRYHATKKNGRVAVTRKRGPSQSEIDRAASLYERFSGHDAEIIGKVKMRALPKAGVAIGHCTAICYVTVRDGEIEDYIHEFADRDAPLFVVSPDGKQILLVGGRFTFTERGIVDSSDKS